MNNTDNSIMEPITIVTCNEDKKYNTISIFINEQNYDEDIADALNSGESEFEDTSGMTEVDLGDGSEYGKVYVDISEDDPRFEEIEEIIQGAGSYLHEMDPKYIDDDNESEDE